MIYKKDLWGAIVSQNDEIIQGLKKRMVKVHENDKVIIIEKQDALPGSINWLVQGFTSDHEPLEDENRMKTVIQIRNYLKNAFGCDGEVELIRLEAWSGPL